MTETRTISEDAARELLDLGSRIGDEHRAREQLRGAVAIHNILHFHGVPRDDQVGQQGVFCRVPSVRPSRLTHQALARLCVWF